MSLKITLPLMLSVALLAGCAANDGSASPSSSASESASSTESASPTPTAGRDPDATTPADFETVEGFDPAAEVTPVQAAMIVRNTFQLFDEQGIVETFNTDEGEFVMVHNPAQKDQYMAAWFNEVTGEGELIFDAHEFSSAWAYFTMNDEAIADTVYFAPAVGGFSLQVNDPTFGPYGYSYNTDGKVLTSASWLVTDDNGLQRVLTVDYNYQVSDEWKQRLDEKVAEFLAESE